MSVVEGDKNLRPLDEVPDWVRSHVVRDAYGRRILVLTKHDFLEMDFNHDLLKLAEQFLLVSRVYIHEVWAEQCLCAPITLKRFLQSKWRWRGANVTMRRYQVNLVDLKAVDERALARFKSGLGESDTSSASKGVEE